MPVREKCGVGEDGADPEERKGFLVGRSPADPFGWIDADKPAARCGMAEQDAQQPVGGGAGGGSAKEDAAMAALKAAQAAIAASKAAPAAGGGGAPAVGAIGGPKVSDEEAEAAMMAQMGLDPSAMSAGSGSSSASVGASAAAVAASSVASQPATAAFAMPNLGGGSVGGTKLPDGIELLGDVNLHVKIELGRTRMLVEDVLRLGEGSVVELDKLAGDPVDIYVNDRPVARGEVLVLNDNFCVRINEIIQDPGEGGRKTA